MNILVDFHQESLLESLYKLFEDRLGYSCFRPIGLEWFEKGFWKINDSRDTAEQFLSLNSIPGDGTQPLNDFSHKDEHYIYKIPRDGYTQKGLTFDQFLEKDFDLIIASIPTHIEPFKKLAQMKGAKFAFQVGNQWDFLNYSVKNVLASIKSRAYPSHFNVVFYHQEFDTEIFKPKPMQPTKKIYSFINILQSMPRGWQDFKVLEDELSRAGFEFKSFGGQCRDGNIDGPHALADKIAESMFVFHVKDHGDGFGHVIHNAYAMGRPVITRLSDYRGKLAGDLMIPGTFIDLDQVSYSETIRLLLKLAENKNDILSVWSNKTAQSFKDQVDYNAETERIQEWLKNLQ
jgi:hypothetical protein